MDLTAAAQLPPLLLADGSGPAHWATRVRLAYDGGTLAARFECVDDEVRASLRERDAPLWQEEVVEIFLAPGSETPTRYFEFEVNPLGALFDARVHNPNSRRSDMRVDVAWNCSGIRWRAGRLDREGKGGRESWWAEIEIPLAELVDGPIPSLWRANVYRVERPRDAPPEFSCWSPTLTDPADFHRPERFGVLYLGAGSYRQLPELDSDLPVLRLPAAP
ncbi:MAG: carbohydrate-binding family 9-like protein [Acidobacteriota bacterium]